MSTLTIGAEHGTDEWHDERRGLVTASVVGRLITTRTLSGIDYACPECGSAPLSPCLSKVRRAGEVGAPIKSLHPDRTAVAADACSPPVLEVADNDYSRGLTMTLFAERVTGWTEDNFVNADMYRGIMCEPIARDVYSKYNAKAAESGFMRHDDDGWTLGYSPDGVVGDDGLIEIKAPRAKTHLATILADEMPAQHMPQCQAGLLVTGREWIDYVSFCGGLPLYVKRVFPDPAWFAVLEAACRRFEATVAEMTARYESSVTGLPQTERVFDLEIVI